MKESKEMKALLPKITKKRVIVSVSCVLVLAVVGMMVGFMSPGGGGGGNRPDAAGASTMRTVTLEKGDLASTVSATGTVYSADSTPVYSNVSYPVQTVHVSVGDTVNEGDVLAELDMSTLASDIAQKKASVSASQATAQQNLATAQKDLETYQRNADDGYATHLLNAETSITTAELDLQTAELEVVSAANACRTAKSNLQDAKDIGEIDETLDTLRETLRTKELALEKAQASRDKAQATLEKAQSSLEATKVSSGDSISTYEDKVKSAQLSTNFNDQWIAIQKLEDEYQKGVITAPVSGTVTAVTAVEGGSGNGQLFVIQDSDNLKIVTNIKEYDIDTVSIGDKVTIKADATGDTEFTGTLSKIAPTSTLTTAGEATSSTDAEFESEVTVTGDTTGMRIGMNTRLSIVTEEKTGVFSVPYEAIETDEAGRSVIYALHTAEDGAQTVEAIPVEKGLETNLYVEVSGDSLTEGLTIVKNAENVDKSLLAGGDKDSTPNERPAPQGEGSAPQVDVSSSSLDEETRQEYMDSMSDLPVEGEASGPEGSTTE